MPFLKVTDVRKMSAKQRDERLRELRAELLKSRSMVRAGGTVENPMRVREARRTIARILTVQNEESQGVTKA